MRFTVILRSQGPNAVLYANALNQFTACRQPWDEYIGLLAKSDATPFHVDPQENPAYRGRKRGREGWLFGQQVQLHYGKFPDEHLFTNLTRWRLGNTVGDIAMQQFRNAQPFDIEDKDPQGFMRPAPEVYMKLNYKNPATISRFLTRTGHMYPNDVLPLNPEAVKKLRLAKLQAIKIGLYPRQGNPFWFRSQKFRPKPYQDAYDPMSYSTKHTMEHFAYTFVQTDRIRKYFGELSKAHQRGAKSGGSAQVASSEAKQQGEFYTAKNDPLPMYRDNPGYVDGTVGRSGKNPTVPGLMSTQGMKKKFHNLYSSTSKKRMGFSNPVLGIKKV